MNGLTEENSALAQQLIDEALVRYGVGPGQLTIHQDRGAPMTAHNYLELMGEFKVTSSHSRPRVSNDNPFSESQFKTCKYQPDYPGVFTNVVIHASGLNAISIGTTLTIFTVGLKAIRPNKCSRVSMKRCTLSARSDSMTSMRNTPNGLWQAAPWQPDHRVKLPLIPLRLRCLKRECRTW